MARTTVVRPKAKTARSKRAANDGVASRLIAAREEEQRRIARDLHDGFQQKLAMLEVDAARIVQQNGATPEIATAVESLRTRMAELSSDLRRVAHQLHPSILDHIGLRAALHSFCAEFSARERILVEFAAPEDCGPAPEETALHLYRIAQESLRNIARHANAKSATVSLERADGSIHLSIRDDGVGFSGAGVRSAGIGLVTMRERARLIGGEFTLQSKPGRGARIDIHAPVRKSAKK